MKATVGESLVKRRIAWGVDTGPPHVRDGVVALADALAAPIVTSLPGTTSSKGSVPMPAKTTYQFTS
ncbi:hypothetical protein SAMN05661080_03090 [Modestobacter sp. DSM 44400]|uniref:hypothetical protein n=1 Tax=Modestobacter sp. DSM 44400 TaxID=1550230 RepID=UPI0008972B26|nr:hypothetical protein [Modestobacter sp. DSM 44400]SDY32627.1 hypothetical protein SAMN05661080_03090 [Modestobacter sp. DSM 44400]